MLTCKLFPAAAPVFRAAAPTWRDRVAGFPLQPPLHCMYRGGGSRAPPAGRPQQATVPCGHQALGPPSHAGAAAGPGLTLLRAPVRCLEPITLLVSLYDGDTRQTRARQPLLLCISRHILFFPSLSKSSRWDRRFLPRPSASSSQTCTPLTGQPRTLVQALLPRSRNRGWSGRAPPRRGAVCAQRGESGGQGGPRGGPPTSLSLEDPPGAPASSLRRNLPWQPWL